MKKMLLLFSLSLGLIITSSVFAQNVRDQVISTEQPSAVQGDYNADYSRGGDRGSYYQDQGQGGRYHQGENAYYGGSQPGDACCGQPQEHACGDCYCLYCKYEPCYYNNWRCENYCVPCKKQCCRYVPKYYEKCCVRYVPQQYTETCCRYCPEYYCVEEQRQCKKWVCDKCCKWVPRYYYKHVCNPNPCAPAACPCQ